MVTVPTEVTVPCVFHEESTPSLKVWDSGRFQCYGCKETGHVAEHPKVREAAEKAGMEFDIPEPVMTLDQLRDANQYAESLRRLRDQRKRLVACDGRHSDCNLTITVNDPSAADGLALRLSVPWEEAKRMAIVHLDDKIADYESTMREFGVDPSADPD